MLCYSKCHYVFQGDLVYVNYGRVEDFTWLEENTAIDLHGKIAIARYGKINRGNKVSVNFWVFVQIMIHYSMLPCCCYVLDCGIISSDHSCSSVPPHQKYFY